MFVKGCFKRKWPFMASLDKHP